ncbi:S8 family peptidase [Ideonella sp. BN130291]|uniref:S8 family peptidase n=1 Tax=Ideonella sp. BN130291 TaxID=3112940 RepID=UPI002E271115|nr:S8 family peptidase [Ideonella sp. BN130291]
MRSVARWAPALACALMVALAGPAQAERAGARPTRLPQEPLAARVIVKFKAEDSGRKQVLAARSAAEVLARDAAVAQALAQRAHALGQRHGFALRAAAAIDDRTQVVTADSIDSQALAARLAADPDVEYAVVDGRKQRFTVPNDLMFVPTASLPNGPASGQWYLKAPAAGSLSNGNEVISSIDAVGAWSITTGHRSIVVAVLDTGVRGDHPDLAGKLLPGYDMVTDVAVANDGNGRDADPSDPGDWITAADKNTTAFKDCDISDSSWHGTMTAGLVGAATNNATGMAGTGWNVKVLPVRVLGKCFGYDSDIIAGMRWAAGLHVNGVPDNPNKAKVINLSLGGEGACNSAYTSAVTEITAAGAVIVAAAGNTTGHAVSNPANCPGVIGVAAVRHIGTKVGFSDVGPEITVAAPGGNCVNLSGTCLFPILTTSNTGTKGPSAATYTDGDNISVGTSFSAPLVSGTAALMMAANRSLTPAAVISVIKSTARAFPQTGAPPDNETGNPVPMCHAPNGTDQLECYCTTSTCGAGLLDARAAVTSVARLEAYIDVNATTVAPGEAVTFSSTSTVLPAPRTLKSRNWSLVDGGGIVTTLGDTTTGDTVSATPSGEGTFTVRLTLVDDTDRQSTMDQTITVQAAGTTPPPTTPPPSNDSGGGGAMSAVWLAALALAVALLAAARWQAARLSRPSRRR